jgi:hypothetical protein
MCDDTRSQVSGLSTQARFDRLAPHEVPVVLQRKTDRPGGQTSDSGMKR